LESLDDQELVAGRPFKGEGSVLWTSRVILERPECAKWLAAVVAGWSNAETLLAWQYQMLCSEIKPACESGMAPGPAASVAGEGFDLIIGSYQKHRIFMAALARRHLPSEVFKRAQTLLNKLRDAGDERIVAAHGRWGICPNLPNELVWARTSEGVDDMRVYGPKDFKIALDRIDRRAGKFAIFFGTEILPRLKSEAQGVVDRVVAAKNLKKAT
jgi:hypothetical protein